MVKKENKTIAFSGLSKCISHNLPEVSPRGGTENKILREEREEECAREPMQCILETGLRSFKQRTERQHRRRVSTVTPRLIGIKRSDRVSVAWER